MEREGGPVPAWLSYRPSRRPLVVVAPHGGRRRRPVRRGDGVNDLYTAEFARELADRLDAVALVNHGLDRNHIDLNRIGDLVSKAPGFLELLRQVLESSAARGTTVLFVHGWNMVVPCCDLGLGLRRLDGSLYGRYPTVSQRFFRTAIARLEAQFARRGLRTAVGLRYPGNGRDNALQLFSGRHATHTDAGVRWLAAASLRGEVDAVQIELGIPLRWPGAVREAALESLVAAAPAMLEASAGATPASPDEADTRAPREWRLPAIRQAVRDHGEPEPGFSLQAVLEGGDLGVFAGVEATTGSTLAARLCLVAGDGRMFLVVAEAEWDGRPGRYRAGGLSWREAEDASWEISFSGAMVAYSTHRAYEDLESGLAGSVLTPAEIALRSAPPADSEPFRGLSYRIQAGDLRCEGDARALCERGSRRGPSEDAPRARVSVLEGEGACTQCREVSFDEAARVLTVEHPPGRRRTGSILACVPVYRPLRAGGFGRFSFGSVRFEPTGGEGVALAVYERMQPLRDV